MADGMVRRLVIAAVAAVVLGAGSSQAVLSQTVPDVVPTSYERPRLDEFWGGSFFTDAVVSPNGRVLATVKFVGEESAIELFDMQEARTKRAGGLDMPFHVYALAWKDQNRLLLTGWDRENRLGVWVWKIGDARARKLFRFDAQDDDYAPDPKFDTEEESNSFYTKRDDARRAKPRPDRTWLVSKLNSDPDRVLIGTQLENVDRLVSVDLNSLESKVLDEATPDHWTEWFVSNSGVPLIRREQARLGSSVRLVRLAQGAKPATTLAEFPFEEHYGFDVLGPSTKPDHVTVRARQGNEEFAAIYDYDLVAKTFSELRIGSSRYDMEDAIFNPDNTLVAGIEAGRGSPFVALNPKDQARFEEIQKRVPVGSMLRIKSITPDDGLWTVETESPTDPGSLWVHDARFNRMLKIGQTDRVLNEASIGTATWLDYQARDGQALEALLLAPVGAQETMMPLVVMPHGGPHGVSTDNDWDRLAAFLASRGYLVAQPNFRGSGGKGRSFALAGYRQWGGRMQDDVTDLVGHLVKTGRVDPKRVAIVGGSYGGYAALAGAALTPNLYQCAASINGVSDLMTKMDWVSRMGNPVSEAFWKRTVGDPAVDRVAMDRASPLKQVSAIKVPVLLLAGDLDDIVDPKNSQLMYDALSAAKKNARLVRFPRMKHSPARYTDSANVFGEIDYFLQNCIGTEKLTSGPPANRAKKREALVIMDTSGAVPAKEPK
ncbi:alpha/beta fold hydrolase [Aquidulcibacter sp.]|jgi:dipeptidyl aminopeptidase/acylaminoacyl peptidase|uniref:alpha/beta hydrolase family protein n=1 Tax=Aquidulcibacter sp. TaxID=2052990 RepID=UPI0028ADDD6C|nr:alpha/beta fold hydrolase [Aquidulcibacter sp.]